MLRAICLIFGGAEHLGRAHAAACATAYKSAYVGCRNRFAPFGNRPRLRGWPTSPAEDTVRENFRATQRVCSSPLLRALDNVNTPEEYAQALATLGAPPAMRLKVQYYALMREQAGRSEETLETSAATPADLYQELVARYGFTLSREQLKVAVNSEFADWSRRLAVGDAVVFIPPVAGG